MFELTLPVGELLVRGTVIYLALLVFMRVVGQRQTGALGITDVLVVVLISEAASPGLHGDAESIADAIIVVVTILCWSVAVDAVSYRWPVIGRFLKSTPKVLIRDGQLNRKVMRRELMSDEEVASVLRLEGVDDVSMVKLACLEPNGMVSVERRDGGDAEAPRPPAAT